MLLAVALTGCVDAPQLPSGSVADRILEAAPGSIGLECADAGLQLAWSVSPHPLVARYELVIRGSDGFEAHRQDLGADGAGSVTLPGDVVTGCTPCTLLLEPIDADGAPGDVLIEQQFTADADGDGFATASCAGSDCDDTDVAIHPEAVEICDGFDQDCNDIVDDVPGAPPAALQHGVCAGLTQVCDGQGGWIEPDYAALADYEATEQSCDGLDNDCDGQADNLPGAPLADVQDGVCAGAQKVCDGQGGWVEPNYGQLADFEADEASCDGLDNDCDGTVDTDITTIPTSDLQDGVCSGALKVCDGANGFVEPDYAVLPDYEATEASCDGLDNDCNGGVDDIAAPPLAALQDGVCAGQVQICDGTAFVEPDYAAIPDYEAVEVTCDGLDNDCSGLADDLAGAPLADIQDGVCQGATKVCDGQGGWNEPDYAVLPGYEADEISCDALDNDCDGTVDDDAPVPAAALQDGVCAGALKVCAGTSGFVEPDYGAIPDYEAVESSCDGIDNDCSGAADDVLDPPLADLQDGVCTDARKTCDGTQWNEPDYTAIPGYELEEASCDGDDNDCDGIVDTDIPGTPLADKQLGVCSGTYKVCDGAGNFNEPDYAALIPEYQDDETRCDALDNDCDDAIDEMLPQDAPLAAKQDGVCTGSLKVCAGSSGYIEPDYTLISDYEALESLCDGLDNDCDTVVDAVRIPDPVTSALECWGEFPRSLPDQIDTRSWRMVASPTFYTYGTHGCAIDTDDHLYCWGENYWGGPLGNGTWEGRRSIEEVLPGTTWTTVSVSHSTTCGIQSDDSLWCWGEYPPGSSTYELLPIQVESQRTWSDVEQGWQRMCAIASDQSLWCWGADDEGQLGLDPPGDRTAAEQVDPGPWLGVGTGWEFSCGVRGDGTVTCWGDNRSGKCGVDPATTTNVAPPGNVITHPQGGSFVAVDAGTHWACAMDSDGEVWCWGERAKLGDGSSVDSFSPVQGAGGPYTSLTVGEHHSCATRDGELWCWGFGLYDSFGDGQDGSTYRTPVQVGAGLGAQATAGSVLSCAVANDASLWCWGQTEEVRQTGPGTERSAFWSGIAENIDGGDYHTCFTDPTGVWCMGDNYYGALGTGDNVDTIDPVMVLPGDFVQVAAGEEFTCALEADGTRWCWGRNRGRLGNSQSSDTNTPWEDTSRSWSFLEAGWDDACGIDAADGTLWCWGNNQNTPVQMGLETWKHVAIGQDHFCAIDGADDLWCWGEGGGGKLGNGTTDDLTYETRALVAEPGPWRSVAAGRYLTCAVKPDDTLWCFGGGVGDGTWTTSLVPVQVPGSWQAVRVGQEHACALDETGAPWCWGSNYSDQLGRPYDELIAEELSPWPVVSRSYESLGTAQRRTCVSYVEYDELTCP